jgi:hypothetical protein
MAAPCPRFVCAAVLAVLLAGVQPALAQSSGSNGSYLGSRLLPSQSEKPCAATGDPMYQADAIVTGTDMRQRPWGFAQTLREVLVKVSGDPRLRNDPRTDELAAHADSLVACFDDLDLMAATPLHDDQGTADRPNRLNVRFDPAKLDAALAELGDRPWRGERPAVVPVLLIRGRKPPPYVLTAEIPAGEEQRGSFANAAGEFGMTVRLPTETELAEWGASAEHFPFPHAVPPKGASPGEAIVVGTLDWSETLPGWIGSWRTTWQGADHRWGIKGVNYDAAFRDIVGGIVLLASGRGSPD